MASRKGDHPVNAEKPHARCGAKTRSGSPCRRAPATGRTRCKLHGGATPLGAASPSFKDGRHSKYLPARLLERYNEAAADPELLNLSAEIALIDARLGEVLGRVDKGESGAAWKAALTSLAALKAGIAEGSTRQTAAALTTLEGIIADGLDDYNVWTEIETLLEQRRKLVESEQKRLTAAQQMITSGQAMTLVVALIETVKRHVTDRDTLGAISADIAKLTAISAG